MRDTLEGVAYVLFICVVVATGIIVLCAGAVMIWTAIYAGTVIEYEGTVQTVTRSNFLAPCTTVVLRTYSEDDVHFTLAGYHDFDIGAQYKIRMTMRPYVYSLVCWGKIMDPSNIERVEAEG